MPSNPLCLPLKYAAGLQLHHVQQPSFRNLEHEVVTSECIETYTPVRSILACVCAVPKLTFIIVITVYHITILQLHFPNISVTFAILIITTLGHIQITIITTTYTFRSVS